MAFQRGRGDRLRAEQHIQEGNETGKGADGIGKIIFEKSF